MMATSGFAQTTYEQVRNILVTKCSPACHGNNNYSFNITDPSATLYDSLLNATPTNTFAAGNNFKLIDPGYPDRSYLLRKVANCISTDLALDSLEGAAMPENETPLLKEEIELIRQWILYGAPDTGTVIDKTLIDSYYQNGGMPLVERPTPPKSCEGFQIHMGPMFYAPGEEAEYYQRYDLNLNDSIEVIGLEVAFNPQSHHFILTKYLNNTAQDWPQGLVKEGDNAVFGGDKEFLMAWQDLRPYNLPNGTAFIWDQNDDLDLNFHLFNSSNQIVLGEVYINVFTQPKGMALTEMKSDLVSNYSIVIPNDSQNTVVDYHYPLTNASISNITAHTHKTGVNFDVYFRNANGTKGAMIYKGTYNYSQGFDTGIFDWHHPPVAFYEPFINLSTPVNNGSIPTGLILEATYNNTTADTLSFGVTTLDEMMVVFIQYVEGSYNIPNTPPWTPQCTETYFDPCKNESTIDGIETRGQREILLRLFPNPSSGSTMINYELASPAIVRLEVMNILGETVNLFINNELKPIGPQVYQFDSGEKGPGIYFVRLSINDQTTTQKLVLSGN